MYILPSGPVAYFDVDDTLVLWSDKYPGPEFKKLEIKHKNKILERFYIQKHVDELKLQKDSGTFIVVWSGSGSEWANSVVIALGLEGYVDVILSKPSRIYDDQDPKDWMPKRRFYA